MKKHYFVIFCCVLFLFILSSCGRNQESIKTSTEMLLYNTTETKSLNADENAKLISEHNRFLGGLQQRTTRIGDVLYYSQYGGKDLPMIFAVDLDTMEAFPLCGKPECEHKDKSCNAFAGKIGTFVQLSSAQDQLYYLDLCSPNHVVYRLQADGTERTEVAVLPNEYEVFTGGSDYTWFGIYKDQIVRCTCGDTMEENEIKKTAIYYVQPLDSSQEAQTEEIFRVENARKALACLDGDILYCAVFQRSATDEMQLTIYSYRMDKKELEELYIGPAQIAQNMAVKSDRLIFSFGPCCYAFSLKDHTMKEICNGSFLYAGDDVILCTEDDGSFRCLDYEGNLIYEGNVIPDEIEARGCGLNYAGCSDNIFYFLLSFSASPKGYGFLAVDTNSRSSELLFSVDLPEENLE
ncbi:MAG: hypothetical protein II885_18200 [Oscillospiraceae bacterium]|nr:hypothetical protein [Oscillospiraceae bacterium]